MSDEYNEIIRRLDLLGKQIVRVNNNQEMLSTQITGMQGQMDGMQLELENVRSDIVSFRADVTKQFGAMHVELRGYRMKCAKQTDSSLDASNSRRSCIIPSEPSRKAAP